MQDIRLPNPEVTSIAILGSHPATVAQAPFSDPDCYIYACSPHNFELRKLPRFDAWCELHIPVEDPTRSFSYLRYVSNLPLVWMRDTKAMPDFPGSRLYPEKEMLDKFGPFSFTSSIAYMLAKAIADCEEHGIKRIGIWGVMQASPTEYSYQRPAIQQLIWQATQRGIKVMAPQESRLFDPPNEKW
jgi:hypothetical protein